MSARIPISSGMLERQASDLEQAISLATVQADYKALADLLRLRFDMLTTDWEVHFPSPPLGSIQNEDEV